MGLFRPQHLERVTENIIKQFLNASFWLSPLAFWKIYELSCILYRLLVV